MDDNGDEESRDDDDDAIIFPIRQITGLDSLTPDDRNLNMGSERGSAMLTRSLQRYGAGRSVLVDRNGKIIAGNHVVEQAAALGMQDVFVVRTRGDRIVVVQRTDLDLDEDVAARELAISDNRTSELNLTWNADEVLALIEDGMIDPASFWTAKEIGQLTSAGREVLTLLDDPTAPADPDDAPAPATTPQSRFPLAIILDLATLREWEATKKDLGVTNDTQGFLALLNAYRGETESD